MYEYLRETDARAQGPNAPILDEQRSVSGKAGELVFRRLRTHGVDASGNVLTVALWQYLFVRGNYLYALFLESDAAQMNVFGGNFERIGSSFDAY